MFIYGLIRRSFLIVLLSLAQFGLLLWYEISYGLLGGAHHSSEATQIIFNVDGLAITMNLIISIIGSLIAIYSIKYMKDWEHHHHDEKNTPNFFFFMIMFLGAMNGLVFANDIVWLYFFWEVTTFTSFILISYPKTDEALRNGVRALWMNSLGGLTFLFAILVLNVGAEHPITSLSGLISQGGTLGVVAVIALGCLVFSAFTKTAQIPFQSWLLGAMVAPTPVSALLHSSAMVKAGVYLVVRLAPMFVISSDQTSAVILGTSGFEIIAVLTALVGGLTFAATSGLAIAESNGKRILAYSTIGSLGLIIACTTFGSILGLIAALLMIIFHAISKGLMFLSVGAIEHQIGSRNIEDMRSLVNRVPALSTIAFLGMVTMLLPPFGVLISKWVAMEAAAPNPIIAVLLVLGSVLSVIFWGRWMGNVSMTHYSRGKREKPKESGFIYIPLSILIIGAFAFSVLIPLVIQGIAGDIAVGALYKVTSLGLLDGTGMLGGYFVPFLLFGLIAVILILTPIILKGSKEDRVVGPYYAGERVGEAATPKFVSTADAPVDVTYGNYYLTKYFGEKSLGRVAEVLSLVILAVMLGTMFIYLLPK